VSHEACKQRSSITLVKGIGRRGVAVNSILPTAIEESGVFRDGARTEALEFVKSFRPMQRMGTLHDIANAAEYLGKRPRNVLHTPFCSAVNMLFADGLVAASRQEHTVPLQRRHTLWSRT
jgi:NAD(P)-dependent dehydrogenase (short-subunit alcohol dehydrogenase family)